MPSVENDVRLIHSLVRLGKNVLSKPDFIKQAEKINPRVASLINTTTGKNTMFELLGKAGANYMKAALLIRENKKLIGTGLATVAFGNFLCEPEFQLSLDLPDDTCLRGKSDTDDNFMLTQTGGKNDGLKELYCLKSGNVVYTNNECINPEYVISNKTDEINQHWDLDTTFFNKDGKVIGSTNLHPFEERFVKYSYHQLVQNGEIDGSFDLELSSFHISFNDKLSKRHVSIFSCGDSNDDRISIRIHIYDHNCDRYLDVNMDKNLNVLSYSTSFSQSFPQLEEACANHSQLPGELIKQYDMEEFWDIYKQLPAMLEEAKAIYREKISQADDI